MSNEAVKGEASLERVIGRFLQLWAPSPPSSRPSTTAPVKKEEEEEGDGGGSSSTSNSFGGGIALGTVVFAPYCVKQPTSTRGGATGAHPVERHYALAEVTGIQSSAGTVTVAFLFADPGVDDEAVALFDLIPCPPGWLQETVLPLLGTQEGDGRAVGTRQGLAPQPACSLLERLFQWPAHAGPLSAAHALDALRQHHRLSDVYCVGDCHTCLADTTTTSATAGTDEAAASPNAKKSEEASVPSSPWAPRPLTFTYGEEAVTGGLSIHAFLARSFAAMDREVERRHQATVQTRGGGASAIDPGPAVGLCVFDRYDLLRRFELYMSMRGHRVKLLDGEGLTAEEVEAALEDAEEREDRRATSLLEVGVAVASGDVADDNDGSGGVHLCVPGPSVTAAFGSTCKVWLCMLREDASVPRSVERLLLGVMRMRPLRPSSTRTLETVSTSTPSLHSAGAPPSPLGIDCFVSVHCHSGSREAEAERVAAEQNVMQFFHERAPRARATLQSPAFHLAVTYDHLPPPEEEAPSTATTAASASGGKVKVSGSVFGNCKILLPASREQLLLLQTVRQSAARAAAAALAEEQAPLTPRTKAKRSEPSVTLAEQQQQQVQRMVASALSPALLERIALGNFTDAAAANLFASYRGTYGVRAPLPLPLAVAAAAAERPSAVSGDSRRKRAREDAAESEQRAMAGNGGGGGGGPVFARIADLRHKFCRDSTRFGEAFPVFAAVAALVRDVLLLHHSRRTSRTVTAAEPALPRVALVFPRGNPSGNPLLVTAQFNHALRQLLAPFALYEASPVSSSVVAGPAAAMSSLAGPQPPPPSVLWWHHGGLLLLYCDEPAARFSGLHEAADVVVACGKTAAAWVAANTATTPVGHDEAASRQETPRCFAILSEVEVVPPVQHEAHVWVPFPTPPAPEKAEKDRTPEQEAARAVVERLLLQPPAAEVEKEGALPKVLQQAVTLHHHLHCLGDAAPSWAELQRFVSDMAVNMAHSTPLRLSELQILPP